MSDLLSTRLKIDWISILLPRTPLQPLHYPITIHPAADVPCRLLPHQQQSSTKPNPMFLFITQKGIFTIGFPTNLVDESDLTKGQSLP